MDSDNIKFAKIHVGGNHFCVVDARHRFPYQLSDFAKKFLHPRFGVSGDGILFLEPSKFADVGIRYFNVDGTEAFCANGTRAAVFFMRKGKIIPSSTEAIDVETCAGIYPITMNKLSLKVPVHSVFESPKGVDAISVMLGNPNAVVFQDDIRCLDIETIGSEISSHYDNGANVIFAKVIAKREVNARFWERGVGETLSCGSGICALLAAGMQTEKLDSPLTVNTAGGVFQVAGNEQFELRGPVTHVASGEFNVREVLNFFDSLQKTTDSILSV